MKHLALKSGFIGVMAALSLGAAVSGQVPAIVAEVDGLVLQSDQQLVGKDLVPLSHTQIRDPRRNGSRPVTGRRIPYLWNR